MEGLLLLLAILLVAMLYSSVGHGGASGYLAVLAIAGLAVHMVRPSALMLNVCVSLVAFIQFARAGHFRWKLFWPFALGSIPAAWIGAGMEPDPVLYKRLLALCLLFAVFRLLGFVERGEGANRDPHLAGAILAGLAIGFFSGIVGIGGGIILSPLLLLLRWSTAHEAAAVSALFILVNSMSGLGGLSDHSSLVSPTIMGWVAAAVTGGLIGSWLGARRYTGLRLRRVLGCVLLFASVKLFIA
jgi:uncharacterized protein